MRINVTFNGHCSLPIENPSNMPVLLPGNLISEVLTAPIIFPIKKGKAMVLKAERDIKNKPPKKYLRYGFKNLNTNLSSESDCLLIFALGKSRSRLGPPMLMIKAQKYNMNCALLNKNKSF